MYLLRLSFGIVRANHFMRTTPLRQWEEHAKKFDATIRGATELIIKHNLPSAAYDQACVSTRFGGLGIRKVVDHAPIAFAASYNESHAQCGESWMNVTKVPEGAPSQRAGSEILDRKTLDRLIDQGNDREKQRLRRLDCKHANSWITSLPSATDGRDTIMDPKIYSTAVARLLGLPVYNNSIPCPLCQQSMDVLGDHALCCKKTQDTITRHNRVRNLMFKLGELGVLSPQMEKLGLLGPTDDSKRRPGDVSFANWRNGRGLAIDVAVICPLAASHLHQEEPCEIYAERQKHKRYDAGFKGSRYEFAAMVFETSGAVNSEGNDIIKQLIRFASKRECVGNSSFAALGPVFPAVFKPLWLKRS